MGIWRFRDLEIWGFGGDLEILGFGDLEIWRFWDLGRGSKTRIAGAVRSAVRFRAPATAERTRGSGAGEREAGEREAGVRNLFPPSREGEPIIT